MSNLALIRSVDFRATLVFCPWSKVDVDPVEAEEWMEVHFNIFKHNEDLLAFRNSVQMTQKMLSYKVLVDTRTKELFHPLMDEETIKKNWITAVQILYPFVNEPSNGAADTGSITQLSLENENLRQQLMIKDTILKDNVLQNAQLKVEATDLRAQNNLLTQQAAENHQRIRHQDALAAAKDEEMSKLRSELVKLKKNAN